MAKNGLVVKARDAALQALGWLGPIIIPDCGISKEALQFELRELREGEHWAYCGFWPEVMPPGGFVC